ncbi:hypothetical protein [Raoultibacter massiliensis]|uniref:YtxH domain-containing protein n=1 Tax=Raoultibacter massiliensis TaxID=1852371 RepID=A0ABV1JAK7_9ACTN
MKNVLIFTAAIGAAFIVGSKIFGNGPKETAGAMAESASNAIGGAKKKATQAVSHAKEKASKASAAAKTVAHDAGDAVKEAVDKA